MHEATRYAIQIPLEVMKTAFDAFDLVDAMVKRAMSIPFLMPE